MTTHTSLSTSFFKSRLFIQSLILTPRSLDVGGRYGPPGARCLGLLTHPFVLIVSDIALCVAQDRRKV